jgi:lipid-A-disaccharide synthase
VRVFLSTADASGDLHAAALIDALRKRVSSLSVFGLGGGALEKSGLEAVVPQSELAIGGLVEVVSSLPRVLRAYTNLRQALRARPVDVAVLVDSPDLNLPLASVARRSGVPVLYYIAPQVWAWRSGRIRKLRRRVNHVGVIFPFEESLLRDAGVPATFVGHPLVDRMGALRRTLQPELVAREIGIELERPVLGLLPGSRRNEMAANLPCMLEMAELLGRSMPGLQVLLLLAPTLAAEVPALPPAVRAIRARTHEAMALSTCLVAAPGTATVEAALLRVPHVVTHQGHWLSFEIVRRMSRVPSSCMMNLVAESGVVPERLQKMARPARLAALVAPLLEDPAARERMCQELDRAVERLGPPHASERAADLVLEVAEGG